MIKMRARFRKSEGILFDIDGTLVDSNEFHVIAWDEAFRENSYSISRYLLRKQIGKGSDKLIPFFLPESSDEERRVISDAHNEIFRSRFLKLVRPFPFATDLIRFLHSKNKKVLLVSSSPSKEIEHYVDLLGVSKELHDTVGFDDVSQSKPAPDLFDVALQKAEVSSEAALAVGDTPYDVAAAAKCGVQTIALLSGGFSNKELETAGPFGIQMDVGSIYSGVSQD